MKSKIIRKEGLTAAEEKRLVAALNDFRFWLIRKKIVTKAPKVVFDVDFPFADEDWFMILKENDGEAAISFNTFVSQKCSFEYYQTIVLHEFFHLEVQKLPNKEDAVKLKDDFGDELMKLIDIESDFFTALFYKEHLGFGLVKYLKLYYEGRKIFSDKWIRPVKLERFIGSILSVSKMFLDYPGRKEKVLSHDLYLPTINPIYTDESLHVLVVKKEHIYVDKIKANYNDFVEIKTCYTNINHLTMHGYIETLVKFACNAFSIPIPPNVQKELDQITE